MTGSMYSSRFSKRNGNPYWMAISRCFRKSLSLKVFTRPSSCLPSLFLIQYTACKQALIDYQDTADLQLAFAITILIWQITGGARHIGGTVVNQAQVLDMTD